MMSESSRRIRDIVPILILLAVAVAVLWKAALLRGIPYVGDFTGSDLMEMNFPRRMVLGESLHEGRIPLWLDNIHNGFPHLAEGQTGIFYPPNLVLHSLLPPMAAINYGLILNFFLAGLFTCLFARSLGASRNGALLAGISFMLSGFFVARLKHVNMVNAGAWLPLLLYFVERFNQSKRLRYAAYAGCILAVMILAGHPHVTYYSALAAIAWFLIGAARAMHPRSEAPEQKLATSRKKGTRTKAAKPRWVWKNAVPFLLAIIVMGILAGSLGAVQILPSMELTRVSARSQGMPYAKAIEFPFRPVDFTYFVSPFWRGNPAENSYPNNTIADEGIFWENCAYIGIVGLLFGFLGIVTGRRKPAVYGLTGLLIVAILLALGKYGGLFPLAWKILPGIRYFRFPARFLLIAQLSLAVLAAFGLDWLMERFRSKPKLSGAGAVVGVLVVIIAAADLLFFASRYIGMIDAVKWMKEPETVSIIKTDEEHSRVYTLNSMRPLGLFWILANTRAQGWINDTNPYLDCRQLLMPDDNLYWGVPHFGDRAVVEGGLGISDRNELEGWLSSTIVPEDAGWRPGLGAIKALGMYNVRWILSGVPVLSEDVEETAAFPWKSFANTTPAPVTFLYKNKQALPRAYVVPHGIQTTKAEFIKQLVNDRLNPADEVYYQGALPAGSGDTSGSTARVVSGTNGKLSLDVNMTGNGYLVVTDNHYPGWKAFVDGKPAVIARGNLISRVLHLEKGNHKVEFSFKPATYRLGLFISLLSLLFVSAGLSCSGLSRREPARIKNELAAEEQTGVQ